MSHPFNNEAHRYHNNYIFQPEKGKDKPKHSLLTLTQPYVTLVELMIAVQLFKAFALAVDFLTWGFQRGGVA